MLFGSDKFYCTVQNYVQYRTVAVVAYEEYFVLLLPDSIRR